MSGAILGQAMVIAIDISSSMLVRDVKPSRIEASKRFASMLLRALRSKGYPLLVGLVAFHRRSMPMVDITEDIGLIEKALSSLKPHGKAASLAEAVRESFYMLRAVPPGYMKRVVLITDGNFASDMIGEAAYLLKSSGIRLDVVVVAGAAESRVEKLKGLVDETGGLVLPLRSMEEAAKCTYMLSAS